MIKFKVQDGMLFRMLEEPVPLTPDTEMPCLVRLIQDDSPMGLHNKDMFGYDPERLKPRICTEVIDVNDLSDSNRGSAERGARMKDKTYTPDYISRPSDTIKESMEYSHKTIDDLWEEICLYDMAKLLADEIQIDERIAVALSKVLGSQPTFWMNLSNNYFAAKAQEEE